MNLLGLINLVKGQNCFFQVRLFWRWTIHTPCIGSRNTLTLRSEVRESRNQNRKKILKFKDTSSKAKASTTVTILNQRMFLVKEKKLLTLK